jgi:hypothetical protein
MTAAPFQGLFELRTPADLVRKLRHDLDRMSTSPQDQYAAFDFFVTAEHIVDWIHPTSKSAREQLRSSSPLLRITSHLANGGKHFEARAAHHRSVMGTEKDRYVEEGYVEDGYFEEPLVIHLSESEVKEMGTSRIDAIALARKVLEYWSKNAPAA